MPSVTGTAATTQDHQTVAATGSVGDSGTAATTQDHQTVAATGTVTDSGTAATTQDHQHVASSGVVGLPRGLGPQPGGAHSNLGMAASTVIKDNPGIAFRVNVLTAGSTAGEIHDCAAVADAAAENLVATIPASVKSHELVWPCAVGIVYIPGTSQVASASFT